MGEGDAQKARVRDDSDGFLRPGAQPGETCIAAEGDRGGCEGKGAGLRGIGGGDGGEGEGWEFARDGGDGRAGVAGLGAVFLELGAGLYGDVAGEEEGEGVLRRLERASEGAGDDQLDVVDDGALCLERGAEVVALLEAELCEGRVAEFVVLWMALVEAGAGFRGWTYWFYCALLRRDG